MITVFTLRQELITATTETLRMELESTEAVRGLLSWLFSHDDVHTVIAESLPDRTPSIRVLQRTSFTFIGDGSEPGVIPSRARTTKTGPWD